MYYKFNGARPSTSDLHTVSIKTWVVGGPGNEAIEYHLFHGEHNASLVSRTLVLGVLLVWEPD